MHHLSGGARQCRALTQGASHPCRQGRCRGHPHPASPAPRGRGPSRPPWRWGERLWPSELDAHETLKGTSPTWTADFRRDDGRWDTQSDDEISRFYEQGTYHIRIQAKNTVAWGRGDVELSDFYLEVETAHVAGPLDNEFGVLFRYVDSENFYLFSISSDGYYRLQKLVNDEWETLIRWRKSSAIKTGEASVNRIGVLADGAHLVLLVNDNVVDEVEDEEFVSGSVGLTVGTFAKGGVEIAFDHLNAWELRAE